jgi:hypothetical protein
LLVEAIAPADLTLAFFRFAAADWQDSMAK